MPTSPDYYTNGGVTHYYMIQQQNLPLLDPLRGIPVVGKPLADLIQPDLTTIVNLGYGDPAFGYSTAPANETITFGLLPHVPASTVLGDLAVGTQQGIHDFMSDVPAALTSPITFPHFEPPPLVNTLLGPPPIAVAPTPTNILNTVSSILSNNYAVSLPTRDIVISLLTTVPAYDASLFVDHLAQGDFLGAIEYPIAADVGLASVAGMIEFITVAEAALFDVRAIQSLIP